MKITARGLSGIIRFQKIPKTNGGQTTRNCMGGVRLRNGRLNTEKQKTLQGQIHWTNSWTLDPKTHTTYFSEDLAPFVQEQERHLELQEKQGLCILKDISSFHQSSMSSAREWYGL